jgi:hypothetical protein
VSQQSHPDEPHPPPPSVDVPGDGLSVTAEEVCARWATPPPAALSSEELRILELRQTLRLAIQDFGQWARIAGILELTYGGPRSAADVRKVVVKMFTQLTELNIDVPTPLHVSCIPDRFFERKKRWNRFQIHDEYRLLCMRMEEMLRAGARIGFSIE